MEPSYSVNKTCKEREVVNITGPLFTIDHILSVYCRYMELLFDFVNFPVFSQSEENEMFILLVPV